MQIIHYLFLDLFISLFTIGLSLATNKNEILFFLGDVGERLQAKIDDLEQQYLFNQHEFIKQKIKHLKLMQWIIKPLWGCPPCMASICTIVIYLLLRQSILIMFISIPVTSAISRFLVPMYYKIMND